MTDDSLILTDEEHSLKIENERIRTELKLYLFNLAISESDINYIFLKINSIIDNEIEKEKLCNY
jgi:hypothetical protein